jgi:O-acetyl-ADP-ribose deacetylase (regulator of RNase III)
MREDVGDLWTYPAQYRVVPTNGVLAADGQLIMGAGVALDAKRRFPGLPAALGRLVRAKGNRPFICVEEGVMSFPTKRHWKDPSDPKLILNSARWAQSLANRMRTRVVAMPRVGCGLGGLAWDEVKKVIAPVLDDRFVVLTPEGK